VIILCIIADIYMLMIVCIELDCTDFAYIDCTVYNVAYIYEIPFNESHSEFVNYVFYIFCITYLNRIHCIIMHAFKIM